MLNGGEAKTPPRRVQRLPAKALRVIAQESYLDRLFFDKSWFGSTFHTFLSAERRLERDGRVA